MLSSKAGNRKEEVMQYSRETRVTFADGAGIRNHAVPSAVTHLVVILLGTDKSTSQLPKEVIRKFVTEVYSYVNPSMWESISKCNPGAVGYALLSNPRQGQAESLLEAPEIVLANVPVPEQATMVVQGKVINSNGNVADVNLVTVSAEGDHPLQVLIVEGTVNPILV
jgi:hypothetical protein